MLLAHTCSTLPRQVRDVLEASGGHECLLFSYVEQLHGRDKPWGRFLDAGTGDHSLGWVGSLDTTQVVAVTGDRGQQLDMQAKFSGKLTADTEIVFGNWADKAFLEGRQFDVILADYLIGAIDGFAPYYQDRILPRLRDLLSANGELYIVGTEPIPEKGKTGTSPTRKNCRDGDLSEWRQSAEAQQLICDVCRARDGQYAHAEQRNATFCADIAAAAILLGNDRRRVYREYPLEWVLRQLARIDGLVVTGTASLNINYTARTLERQLGVAERKLVHMEPALAAGVRAHLDELQRRVRATDWAGVKLGVDYVVGAKLVAK